MSAKGEQEMYQGRQKPSTRGKQQGRATHAESETIGDKPERVIYHLQTSFCGKERCNKCREGTGHGPYWYLYRTRDGHTTRHYVGKKLPAGVKPLASTPWVAQPVATSTASNDSTGTQTPGAERGGQERTRSFGRSHKGPLIGRDKEWQRLHDMLTLIETYQVENAKAMRAVKATQEILPLDTQRTPQCMLLTGDTGIGKTRLAEELGLEAQQRGWLVLWSRVYSQESSVPYRTWIELLRRAIQHKVFSDEEPTLPASLYPLVSLLPDLSEQMATLQRQQQEQSRQYIQQRKRQQTMPNATATDKAAENKRVVAVTEIPAFAALGSEQEKLRIQEAVHTLVSMLCERQPVLIVLDDLQWADASSYELLSYLARHSYGYPLLLIGTYRENEAHQEALQKQIAHMQREHALLTQHIEPLSSEEIGLLVSHVTHPTPIPEMTIQHIQAQASGNPFFAEELARSGPLSALPQTITSTLDHRLGKLSDPCQQMLGNAAVLGNTFELPVILAVEDAGNDDDALFDLLEEAIDAHILSEENEEFAGLSNQTRVTYSFWNPLLVQHLYQYNSAARRTRIHQRAALVLQRMYKGREEEVAATITQHLLKSGAENDEVVHYALLAGNRAYSVSAYVEAMQHYQTAMEHIEPVTTFQKRARLAYLLERLGECSMILGRWSEARTFFERLLIERGTLLSEASQTSPEDTPFINSAHSYEAQVQALLWGEIGRSWRYQGNSIEARRCCERGEEELSEYGVSTGLARAKLRYQDGGLFLFEGRFVEALHVTEEALTLFEQHAAHHGSGIQHSPSSPAHHVYSPDILRDNGYMTRIQRTLLGDPVDIGRVHMQLGLINTSQGQLSAALAHLNTALALFERYDQIREIAHAQCNIGHIHLTRGNLNAAQDALQRSLALATRIEDQPLSSVIYSNLAKLSALSAKYDDAELWYTRALSIATQNKDRDYQNRWNVDLAAVLLRQGKFAGARACLVEAFRVGLQTRNNLLLGNALAAIGNYRIAQARAEQQQQSRRGHLLMLAAQDAHRALEGIEVQTRIHSQFVLAQVSLLSGKTARARQELQAVVEAAHTHELASLEAAVQQVLDTLK